MNSTAARMSRIGSAERCGLRSAACRLMTASPPIRSISPRARRRSVFCAIRSRSVAISWNLTVELPVLRTSTFMTFNECPPLDCQDHYSSMIKKKTAAANMFAALWPRNYSLLEKGGNSQMTTTELNQINPLSSEELHLMNAYWRAANYLSVGQIYLYDNPLLKEPLKLEHIKPRLLGHWGTTPGLNFIYVHLNRVIKAYDLNMIFVCGPGHGGPGMVANTYLEGTYSEIYPHVSQDEAGMKRLFKQFSFPGGIPSHVAPETPGSIHEGGELGYSIAHAYGAILDNPDLLACCVIGDGEAETGPLATSWHSNKFVNPATDGAVLPILHLNGYKIANPTVLARISDEELHGLLVGFGHKPYFVSCDDPEPMHQLMAATLDAVLVEIQKIQRDSREHGFKQRPQWPMIVLRSPKGWTGPKVVDGKQVEGTFRAHQVPLSELATKPAHLRMLEDWMKSYQPEELFDQTGRLRAELAELAPKGTRRMGANPHANGGLLLKELKLPDYREYRVDVSKQ